MTLPGKRAPNVLLLVVDCLRNDKLLGARRPSRLQAIPRLIEAGTAFDTFYAVASQTPICFSSLLSGFYPTTHQVQSLRSGKFPPELPTLAEKLRAAGYRTEACMSGPLGPEFGLDRGFDDYRHLRKWGTITGNFGAELLSRLAALRGSQQPWFLIVHFWSLHKFRRYSLLCNLLFRLPPGVVRSALDRVDDGMGRLLQKIGTDRLYDACLRDIDRYLGLVLGVTNLEDTCVLLTGDHGEYLGFSEENAPPPDCPLSSKYHGFHVYDLLTRVPFVAAGPGFGRRKRDSSLRSQVDVTPTILELAGVDFACDGSSLRSAPPSSRPVYLEGMLSANFDPGKFIAGVRFENWKYACMPQAPSLQPELYNLDQDPFERKNLAAQQPALAGRGWELVERHYTAKTVAPARGSLSAEDEETIARRLQELGYIE